MISPIRTIAKHNVLWLEKIELAHIARNSTILTDDIASSRYPTESWRAPKNIWLYKRNENMSNSVSRKPAATSDTFYLPFVGTSIQMGPRPKPMEDRYANYFDKHFAPPLSR
jgi:hypothetical protein